MEFMKKTLMQVNNQSNTLYDIIYNLFFLAKIKESEDDIEKGKYCTLEEFKEYIDELEEENDSKDIRWSKISN